MLSQLLLTRGEKHFVVDARQISHLVADDKTTDIFLIDDLQKFTEYECLSFFENRLLPTHLFIKLNRSTIVNRTVILYFTRHTLFLKGDVQFNLTEKAYTNLIVLLR